MTSLRQGKDGRGPTTGRRRRHLQRLSGMPIFIQVAWRAASPTIQLASSSCSPGCSAPQARDAYAQKRSSRRADRAGGGAVRSGARPHRLPQPCQDPAPGPAQAADRAAGESLDRQIAAVDQLCRDLIAAEVALAERLAILMSIPGIGEATAVAIVTDIPPPSLQRCCASLEPLPAPPKLGELEHRQAASLAGLAPVAQESGTWRGNSFIRGGRGQLRQALYMPALVALRFKRTDKSQISGARLPANPPRLQSPPSCES